MPADTSREAVEALIAECREVEGANVWYEEVADTLAALLDERDALRNANASTVAKWSLDIGRAERAEAERDGLAAKLEDALTAEAQAEWDIPPKVRAILADTNEGDEQ